MPFPDAKNIDNPGLYAHDDRRQRAQRRTRWASRIWCPRCLILALLFALLAVLMA